MAPISLAIAATVWAFEPFFCSATRPVLLQGHDGCAASASASGFSFSFSAALNSSANVGFGTPAPFDTRLPSLRVFEESTYDGQTTIFCCFRTPRFLPEHYAYFALLYFYPLPDDEKVFA
jgi:hypothetical protein